MNLGGNVVVVCRVGVWSGGGMVWNAGGQGGSGYLSLPFQSTPPFPPLAYNPTTPLLILGLYNAHNMHPQTRQCNTPAA